MLDTSADFVAHSLNNKKLEYQTRGDISSHHYYDDSTQQNIASFTSGNMKNSSSNRTGVTNSSGKLPQRQVGMDQEPARPLMAVYANTLSPDIQ